MQTVTYTFTMFGATYCIPLMMIIYCYFHIVRAASLREKNLRDQAVKLDVVSLRTNAITKAGSVDIHVAKVNLMSVSVWVTLWTPYLAIVLQGALGHRDNITPLLTTLAALAAKCVCVFNPVIYTFCHSGYRRVITFQSNYHLFQ